VLSRTCLTLIVTSSLIVGSLACSSGPTPKWDGDIWISDSRRAAVTRKDTLADGTELETVLLASDPFFNNGLWISYDDFRKLYATYVLGCAKWRSGIPMMTAAEALARFRPVIEDMQREAIEDAAAKK
jgi:hypothetical protein